MLRAGAVLLRRRGLASASGQDQYAAGPLLPTEAGRSAGICCSLALDRTSPRRIYLGDGRWSTRRTRGAGQSEVVT